MYIFKPETKECTSFILTPNKVYKNEKLYYNGPALIVWPAEIFHRIISEDESSISVNFATHTRQLDI